MLIPEIRSRLLILSKQIPEHARELRFLAQELKRRTPEKRSKITSKPITPAMRRRVKAYRRRHPEASQFEIAQRHDINPGRVSEILRGKRK